MHFNNAAILMRVLCQNRICVESDHPLRLVDEITRPFEKLVERLAGAAADTAGAADDPGIIQELTKN